jgi:hypothetical protein
MNFNGFERGLFCLVFIFFVHVLPCVRYVRTVYTCAPSILAGKYGSSCLY